MLKQIFRHAMAAIPLIVLFDASDAIADVSYPDSCVPPGSAEVLPLARGIGMKFVESDGDAARSRNGPTSFYCSYEVVGERGYINFQFNWSVDSGPTPVVGGFDLFCAYGPKKFERIGSNEVYAGGGVTGKKAMVRILPVGGVSLKWDDIESAVVMVAENTLSQIRPEAAVCDGYVADPSGAKELERRGKKPGAATDGDAPMIDVDKIPDVKTTPEPSPVQPPECKLIPVDTSSTLYGTNPDVGNEPKEQCVCGLEVVSRSRCM